MDTNTHSNKTHKNSDAKNTVKVHVVNAFTNASSEDCIGGNPAGLVLNADQYTADQKLMIAKNLGLSETAFVSKSEVADFKLDFFTPTRQIAHCGHATIAAFSYLEQSGLIPQKNTSKETIDGIRKVMIDGDLAYMEQLKPTYQNLEDEQEAILQALGLTNSSIIASPQLVNTGNAFVVVGIESMEVLSNLNVNQDAISRISETLDLIGFYVFSLETNLANHDASTRMFAPRFGIEEESATGMAAGPLACYLHDILKIDKSNFKIEQGYAMTTASPSVIDVKLSCDNGTITSLIAGGSAVIADTRDVSF